MNTPTQDITVREHHFCVSISKYIFAHPQRGIVFAQEPLSCKDAKTYDLSPTIFYGVSVADTPIQWLTFSPADRPRPFCDVLQEAWHTAPGLRGHPHRLKVGRRVARASSTFADRLAQIGVQLVVADRQDKLFPTVLRSTQEAVKWLSCGYGDRQRIDSFASLRLAAQKQHVFRLNSGRYSTKDVSRRVERWLALPTREVDTFLPEDLDWSPGGWLSSWEANLPPSGPRHFDTDSSNGNIWLLARRSEATESEQGAVDAWEQETDDSHEAAKILVACWPNKAAGICQASGITSRQLQWYLNNQAPLPTASRSTLLSLLGVKIEERSGYHEATGPCVLIANAPNMIKRAYEHLSHGGDLAFSFEVIPQKMPADPSWRYLLFQSYSGSPNVIMIPHGSALTVKLDDRFLINFGGVREIPSGLYREMVAACARACLAPQANLREMKAFVQRNAERLQELAWQ